MNVENTKVLLKKYPTLYRVFAEDISDGNSKIEDVFRCNDGWFKIIDKYSEKIENIIKSNNLSTFAAQVKEKFGTLRINLSNYPDNIHQIINEAEIESSKTCEICGESGEIKNKKWLLKCLCQTHENLK